MKIPALMKCLLCIGHSSKASILQHSAFFTVQLSHPYMTTGKTTAFTRRTCVGKVMGKRKNISSQCFSNAHEPRITCWQLLKNGWTSRKVITTETVINLIHVGYCTYAYPWRCRELHRVYVIKSSFLEVNFSMILSVSISLKYFFFSSQIPLI